MKQIIAILIVVLFVPISIFLFFVQDEKPVKIEIVSNTIVRVKRVALNRIDKISLEDYIVGVVAGEMPSNFNIEALKAQSVAARTYVLKQMEPQNQDFDVVDTNLNQIYLDNEKLRNNWGSNYETNKNKIKKAVEDTKGVYMTFDGQIISALYFSTSNGYTENSELVFQSATPYLKSVESNWDAEVSPVFTDTKTIASDTFFKSLSLPISDILNIEILERSATNRILKLKINGKEMTGRTVYQLLSLRSTDFSIVKNNNEIVITTKGFGHGVGMSQYGAEGMAKLGFEYEEILKYYYQNISLKNL